ncbi:UNVERIFIED_CONTAM: Retrovirus-related Pol polyprotein from transposon TNT 1-94 [Sesamum latifolium]|uniref:Retrovirus-related Pol polyprotein from transposon TNT 1-94 n=1 Tax=Sesamum latifolium TaxID=2727402 RepID=A0AAW2VD14_9LAMI
MVQSMMSFTKLPPSFWGHALETAVKLLNIAPSKSVPQTPYEIWHGKPASYKYLRVWGSPAYVKRLVGDKQIRGLVFAVLRRSTREFRVPERYGFVGLTNPPKGVRPVGCKWVYKRKLGADREVTAFKARLGAKGYTQRPGVDFEKIYLPVAMAKSIRILLAIAAWYDYEIWQMDVKTAFLNGFVEKEIFMDQRRVSLLLEKNKRSVTSKGPSTASSKLPEAGTHISGSSVAYLVLYVDDILLIGNDVKMLRDIKAWLSTQFSMKDMGEASYILGIKIYRDRSRRMLGLTQSSYIEKARCRLRFERNEQISGMHREAHWSAVKSILKYLKRTKDMFLIYGGGELILEGYSDASFQSDDDDAKSQSSFVFKLNGGVVAWKSSKQDTTADSTTEAEYIAASEAAKEAVWMKNYIQELGVVPSIAEP